MTLTSFMFGKPQMSVLNLLQCKQCNTRCCLWLENMFHLWKWDCSIWLPTHIFITYITLYIYTNISTGEFFPYKQTATLVITGHLLPALLWQNLYDWIQVTNTILSYIYTWTRALPRTTVTKHCHLRGSAGHMHAYFSTKPCTHRLTNNRNTVTRNSSHTGNVSIKRRQSTLMALVRWSWHWPGQPNRSLMRMIFF